MLDRRDFARLSIATVAATAVGQPAARSRPIIKPKGFAWGRCTQCEIKGPTFSIEELLRDRFGRAPYPAISGVSFGHIEQKLVLPIGVTATLDAAAGTLQLDESAVI